MKKKTNKAQIPLSPEMERRLSAYLYLKGQGLTLEEILFLVQESFPKIFEVAEAEV